MFLRDATMLNDIQGTLRDSIESNMLVIFFCVVHGIVEVV
jgi:hypothetical protein